MNILLLNAGSSSLKCTLIEAADRKVIAHALADWAGSVTHSSMQARTAGSSPRTFPGAAMAKRYGAFCTT